MILSKHATASLRCRVMLEIHGEKRLQAASSLATGMAWHALYGLHRSDNWQLLCQRVSERMRLLHFAGREWRVLLQNGGESKAPTSSSEQNLATGIACPMRATQKRQLASGSANACACFIPRAGNGGSCFIMG